MEEKIEKLLKKTIEGLGYELYDVIFEKEAKAYYLRIFIDKPEGISLNDCEKVNDSISGLLDEANYIKEQYFLEVSSPGVERVLRKEKHLQASIEKEITVNLFKPIILDKIENTNKKDDVIIKEYVEPPKKNNSKKKNMSCKQIEGILKKFDKENIVLQIRDKELVINRKDIATMHLKYNW